MTTQKTEFEAILKQRTTGVQHPLHGRTIGEIETAAREDMTRRLYSLFAPEPYGQGRDINLTDIRKLIKAFAAEYEEAGLILPTDLNAWAEPIKLQRISQDLVKRKPDQLGNVVEWFPQRGVKATEHRSHQEFLALRREKRRKAKEAERAKKGIDAHAMREDLKRERE